MKRHLVLIFTILFFSGISFNIYGQTKSQKKKIVNQTKASYLLDYAKKKSDKYKTKKAKAIKMAQEKGWIIQKQIKDGAFMELQGLTKNNRPLYYITYNEDAAVSTATDKVYSGGGLGLSLDGSGMVAGEWDGGDVLTTHQEFNNTGSSRVTDKDGTSSTHYHSTHVAGTIIAGGVESSAKGMAYNANLDAYDWDDDESEMAAAAADGLLISNHSYGFGAGWTWTGYSWTWYGDDDISSEEDYQFGFYSSYCADLDDVANNAPYYLIVKSAGNDLGDGAGQTAHPQDGGADGYDCIGYKGNAKNILTVGAVNDVSGGYSSPSGVTLASFSSTGPCDDGRIKPDIVGNGVNVYSTYNTNNTSYNNLSGTSMSSPNVTGSLLLLQEHYFETQGVYMKAATLKALAIHTADECGSNTGPDYKFGWGLLNTGTAATLISDRNTASLINEEIYTGTTYTLAVNATGTEPLTVTIVWSDPAGTPVAAALDPTDIMLVNDLDMTVSGSTGTYFPYKLSGSSPSAAATTGNNNVDNVEKIYIASPSAGTYTIYIDHEGSITGTTQNFSIIVSGINIGGGDTEAPTAPTSLVYSNETETTVDLSWGASTDNVAVTGYEIFQEGSLVKTVSGTSTTITGLTAGTSYSFYVVAKDAAGNSSDPSNTVNPTTLPSDDTEAPTAPTNLSYSGVTETSVDLSWTASTDNVAVTGYEIYQEGSLVKTVTGTSTTITGLTASTTYSFYVVAKDAAGNSSDPSDPVSVTTDDPGDDCYKSAVTLSLTFDNYPSETSWSLVNSLGTTVASGDGYSTSGVTITESFSLSNDDYTFTIVDSYGDGICCGYGSGSYSLTDADSEQIVAGSDFGSSEATDFCISGSTGGGDMPTGYCDSKGRNTSDEWIDLVQLGSINNATGDDGGYADYTSMSTNLSSGTSYTIYFSTGFSGTSYTEYWKIWIDYNRDGDFDDSGEEVVSGSSSSSSTLSGTFTVPAGISTGTTKMRVSMKYNSAPTSCENFRYGEVEDYAVVLSSGTTSNVYFVNNEAQELGFEEASFLLYPNPANDELNIKAPIHSKLNVVIYNSVGKEIKNINLKENNRIDISDLPAGIYNIKMDDGRKLTTKQFIKQ